MNTMVYSVLPMLLFGGAFIGYAIWMMGKKKKMAEDSVPAWHRFFTQTGYRFAELRQAPVEAQVQLAMSRLMSGGVHDTTYVRDFHGVPVHHNFGLNSNGNTLYTWTRWLVPVSQRPRVLWQIADRSLSSVGKSVREAFSNTSRTWTQAFPNAVPTGNPAIDARFVVFGENPDAVRNVLATPGLADLFLACPEVDLSVMPTEIVFGDHSGKNISGGMQGVMGQMALGTDIAKRFEITYPVHERMAQILATVARASQ